MLYRERFSEAPHPIRRTILKVVKRLRKMGCVTSRPRVRRPHNVGRKVQPEDVLAYALAHRQNSTKDVITDFVENLPLHQRRNVWFQHDGAPPHNISNIKQYLMETFQNQAIGFGGFVEWAPRSPDLTPLDFFLWGHIKGQVYATTPRTLQDLRRSITDTCTSVTPAMLHNVQRKKSSPECKCV
ncbi:hypothetical protein AVEN_117186-1 [Araneus ventricosus]|uniref:DUF4817 domain-containing protein n=1 Tax=Araneus ventricosus TaxID=182803 RepID=A0A4Y2AZD1_ARAVE|nr:hypothetical protein AVEN_117186-1 [Araneus ventricosus]